MTDRERLLDLHTHACWWIAQATPTGAKHIAALIAHYRRQLARAA